MTRAYRQKPRLGLDHYVRCSAPLCDTAACVYAANCLPLCRRHVDDVLDHLRVVVPNQRKHEKKLARSPRPQPLPKDPNRPSIVYYAKVDDEHIKIGYTTSPFSRWSALAKEYGSLSVLVVEPGGVEQEVARQAQFAHLRVRQTELFTVDSYLLDHVKRMRQQRPDWPDLARAAHEVAKLSGRGSNRRLGDLKIPGYDD